MSLRSMTGYGRGEASAKGVLIAVELSSVNRRQLDVHMALPKSLGALESRIYECIHDRVTRGRITGELSVNWSSRRQGQALRVDTELAGAYLKSLRKTARELSLEDDFGGSILLTLPNVMRFQELNSDVARLWPLVKKAVEEALKNLLAMKRREGGALGRDVEHRFDLLERLLERIRARAPQVVKSYRRRLQKRIAEAGFRVDASDDRLLKELAFFADRSDVTEETTRLESHLGQGRKMLRAKPPTGKSLDFLAQELFREINTIGSKANDAQILRLVVSFKAELERIREQVQNIE